MTDSDIKNHEDLRSASRLTHLSPSSRTTQVNRKYSRMIRRVQIILPLTALVLIVVIFNWQNFKSNDITPIAESSQPQQTIGKNELLNPKFESVDEKGQPYTIIAERALQGEADEDLVILDQPQGEMILTSGNVISIESQQGNFRQNSQKLMLNGDVILRHDIGYTMSMEELYVDMAANTAHSDVDVHGHGPDGTIVAKGLSASSKDESLIFNGPAKLVLTSVDGGFDLGGVAP